MGVLHVASSHGLGMKFYDWHRGLLMVSKKTSYIEYDHRRGRRMSCGSVHRDYKLMSTFLAPAMLELVYISWKHHWLWSHIIPRMMRVHVSW